MPSVATNRPRIAVASSNPASGREAMETSPVSRVAGCVCRVWPGYVPGIGGGGVCLPRLAGKRPWYGGWRGVAGAPSGGLVGSVLGLGTIGAFARAWPCLWKTLRPTTLDPALSWHAAL